MRSWHVALFLVSVWPAVIPLAAQATTDIAPPSSARFPAAWYPPDNNVTDTMAPVKGAPYEARMVIEGQNRGLPLPQEPLQARDGAGRMRTETLQPRLGQSGSPITVRAVEVSDPVSHCIFQWAEPWVDKSSPTATVSCMTRTLHYGAQPMWASVASMKVGTEHPSPEETDQTERLGERKFDGLQAIGFRLTRTIGGTQPRSMATEFWVSTQMKELVAMYQEFPNGFSMELRDIKLREPDSRLFYPPANYRIDPVSNHP